MKPITKLSIAALAAIILGTAMSLHPTCAKAEWAGEWSESDTARQIAVTASLYADYRQTVYIFKHPEAHREMNQLIWDPAGYFAVCMAGHAAIAYLLPPGAARQTWQNVILVMQTAVTARNAERGVKSGMGFVVGYTVNF